MKPLFCVIFYFALAVFFFCGVFSEAKAQNLTGLYAYLSSWDIGGGDVKVIDLAGNKIIKTITLPSGEFPDKIVSRPGILTVYVASATSNKIFAIDVKTNQITKTITGVTGITDGVLSKNGNTLYTTDFNSVLVIDTATGTVKKTFTHPNLTSPWSIALTPDEEKLVVTNNGAGGDVYVIDQSASTVSRIMPSGAVPSLSGADTVINPDGKTAYVADPYRYAIYRVNILTKTFFPNPIAGISSTFGPWEMAFNEKNNKVYVTDSFAFLGNGKILVFDTKTNSQTKVISIGNTGKEVPENVAVSPDGTRVYVTDVGTNVISIIDTAKEEKTGEIKFNFMPISIGLAYLDSVSPTGSLAINGGAQYVKSPKVTLNTEAKDETMDGQKTTNGLEMMISNNEDFSGASFEPYAATKAWELTERYGEKRVFVKYKDGAGNVSETYLAKTMFESPYIVTGAGYTGGPHVKAFKKGSIIPTGTDFFAYNQDLRNGVAVAYGDVEGDARYEIITGPGEGSDPIVKVYKQNGEYLTEFRAYDQGFMGGVNVACGDVNSDGKDEIIAGAGNGGGPEVRVFQKNGNEYSLVTKFYAYGVEYQGGVSVAAGDLDGDGDEEVVTGAKSGGGPHVRTFKASGEPVFTPGFFSYALTFRGGVNVAVGDLNGDLKEEIITGPGYGGGPQVRTFDRFGNPVFTPGFYVYAPTFRGGVNVASTDFYGLGKDEILTGASLTGGPHVRMFNMLGQVTDFPGFFAYNEYFRGGVNVASTSY